MATVSSVQIPRRVSVSEDDVFAFSLQQRLLQDIHNKELDVPSGDITDSENEDINIPDMLRSPLLSSCRADQHPAETIDDDYMIDQYALSSTPATTRNTQPFWDSPSTCIYDNYANAAQTNYKVWLSSF
ncbi:uncharacterized protein KNAG_0F01600 [Huiozyma naganishii CBS 8797]|uniref:Uncharacterized protein n=1 Tax=Huiozyma naganishii (strain ATCC MYA-139 / BCRC 22969 / CBS 8797 / KCTC 17520 / NBRC 10181 / NCYC 3082 / Yp74L-3) TaxID=1071383 RepID=J7RMN2_HUIN7|nr:hypothetical protein KNAG_0F01600 [Kazachstania naganishii CBS 8797]CCK70828.1 hypothetical protein KNAG_0F01600 [Kazachstania naganishii CBS 8797]